MELKRGRQEVEGSKGASKRKLRKEGRMRETEIKGLAFIHLFYLACM
jgi:hypothetical protein